MASRNHSTRPLSRILATIFRKWTTLENDTIGLKRLRAKCACQVHCRSSRRCEWQSTAVIGLPGPMLQSNLHVSWGSRNEENRWPGLAFKVVPHIGIWRWGSIYRRTVQNARRVDGLGYFLACIYMAIVKADTCVWTFFGFFYISRRRVHLTYSN